MKVLIFHQYFGTSEDIGAGTRTYEIGRRMVRRGDSVTIITGDAVYFSGEKATRKKRLWHRENIEGIEVIRVHIPFGGSHSILPRIIGFLWFIPFGLLAGFFANAPEVVVATSTPLTIGIPGYLLSRLRRVPFVLELRDLWPDCVVAWEVVQSEIMIRTGYWLEAFLYRKAHRFLAVTDGIRLELIKKGLDPASISVITNASDIELFNPSGPRADLRPWPRCRRMRSSASTPVRWVLPMRGLAAERGGKVARLTLPSTSSFWAQARRSNAWRRK